MAVALECLNLLIPVRRIAAVWPGGFAGFWREHGGTPRLWHDGRLLRDGAMNPIDLELAAGFWERRGLRRHATAAGPADIGLVDAGAGWLGAPCPWLELDLAAGRARLRRVPDARRQPAAG